MKSLAIVLLGFAATTLLPQAVPAQDLARWERTARRVTIIRDDWGIPHVYGTTDADAVFGLMYAQAEDDFNRVETNYLDVLGRLAEAEGEAQIWHDLRARLFVDPDSMRAMYRASPAWLKRLMDAFADGLNFYLYKHPEVRPRVITRFEPWMALAFSEGSIGPDLEQVNLAQLQAFYGGGPAPSAATGGNEDAPPDPTGSNGIAIAPANTAGRRALLLINPHTSFFFRAEVQMVSREGLNAYGAVTWGQFFIYQGFNERLGWMHTSSGVDAIDEYLETVVQREGRWYYRHGSAERPATTSTISVPYRTRAGMAERRFTVHRTHHGPIVRRAGEQWVSIALMQQPMNALIESYTRTKARDYPAFRRTVDMRTNSSNNTIYADADGSIAYFHASYIPRRDTAFDWTRPVDGSNLATDYRGLLTVDESPLVVNPASGWVYNTNDAPWWAAGMNTLRKSDFPGYVESGAWSARGRHVARVVEGTRDFTLESLTRAAFDPYLTWFETPLPALLRAWDEAPDSSGLKQRLREPIELLRGWDLRWSAASVPTSLAVLWGENISRRVARAARGVGLLAEDYIPREATSAEMLEALAAASDTLAARYGTWRTPWGEINRFQRLTGDIAQPFNDSGPSIPVAFTAGQWGSLAAFGARTWPGTRKRYGTSGNSFVAVVEFGDRVRAVAVTAGGLSGRAGSPHFNDQAERYATGNLREIYFYRPQLQGHIEREYHPGS